ncbi:HAD family hydrolase [Nocardia sp. NPDC047038]|uniref:HAD family hydrolase n=1 Tax=Nocardia sp. NPDC047038 TaxID=3154338 RepID=UPI0033F4853E
MVQRLIILDLDGTCYPSDSALTRIIDTRTTEFLTRHAGLTPTQLSEMEERTPSILEALARLGLPRQLWASVTYRAIPYRELLRRDPRLIRALSRVAARRVVVTMAPEQHAIAVLEALGLTGVVDDAISVFETGHTDKRVIYRSLVETYGASTTTVLGDNVALDLEPAAVLGCGCAHIHPRPHHGPFHVYRDLLQALSTLQ